MLTMGKGVRVLAMPTSDLGKILSYMHTQCQLSLEEGENDARQYGDERGEIGGFGCSNGKVK